MRGAGELGTCLCSGCVVSTVTEVGGGLEHLGFSVTRPNGDLGKEGVPF